MAKRCFTASRNSKNPQDRPPTLAEAGIDKNLAHRARRAAPLSPEEFEDEVVRTRAAVTKRDAPEIEDFIEGFKQPTLRINEERVPVWSSQRGRSGL